jgi:hypothetical protein
MINLIPLTYDFTIYQLSVGHKVPYQIYRSGFCSVTKTSDEISIVTNCNVHFKDLKSSTGWKGFKVEGILDFSKVGIIHDITRVLKENNISVFVISTYNTDYIFVKNESLNKAKELFRNTENINVKDE